MCVCPEIRRWVGGAVYRRLREIRGVVRASKLKSRSTEIRRLRQLETRGRRVVPRICDRKFENGFRLSPRQMQEWCVQLPPNIDYRAACRNPEGGDDRSECPSENVQKIDVEA